jgi:hypothetical protein
MTGLPWVADFRDPWTQNAGARNTGWRFRFDEWVEERVLKTADKVIGVTPTYTQELQRLAPSRAADAFLTIENGFDQADFAVTTAPVARPPESPVELAHVGKVYDDCMPFLKALEVPGDDGRGCTAKFIGGLAKEEEAWLAAAIGSKCTGGGARAAPAVRPCGRRMLCYFRLGMDPCGRGTTQASFSNIWPAGHLS